MIEKILNKACKILLITSTVTTELKISKVSQNICVDINIQPKRHTLWHCWNQAKIWRDCLELDRFRAFRRFSRRWWTWAWSTKWECCSSQPIARAASNNQRIEKWGNRGICATKGSLRKGRIQWARHYLKIKIDFRSFWSYRNSEK